MGEVYILHFSQPLWRNAQHYCGYTKFTAEERLKSHVSGMGSKFCKYANDHGITYEIVYKEHFDTNREARKREIQLKRERNLRRHCSVCQD